MSQVQIRSPYLKTYGLVYFARMLDKIRTHAIGELPAEYQVNLGKGFDAECTTLLRIDYNELVDRVKKGGHDDKILQWCFKKGRRLSEREIFVWNEFMRKRGWDDDISEILTRRKKEAGMADRSDIKTMFAFIDADEGRPPIKPINLD